MLTKDHVFSDFSLSLDGNSSCNNCENYGVDDGCVKSSSFNSEDSSIRIDDQLCMVASNTSDSNCKQDRLFSDSTMSSQLLDDDKCSVKIHKYNKRRRRKKSEDDDNSDEHETASSISSTPSSTSSSSSSLSHNSYSHSSSSSHRYDGHDKNNTDKQNTSRVTRCNQNLNSFKISNRYKPILTISSCLTFISYCNFFLLSPIESCSSRSTPKPRLTSPTSRPNVTFQTYACPEAYAKWYCLNGATCFAVRIGESILYNCECAHGYIGQRCEFKDLEGSYLPSRDKVLIATANMAGGVTFAVFFVVVLCVALMIRKDFLARRRRRVEVSSASAT